MAAKGRGSRLFNPFATVNGWPALRLGLAAMAVASLIGWLGRTHFDGVLDVHTGAGAPYAFHLAESLLDWLAMALAVYAVGSILNRRWASPVQVLGTQALARAPMMLAVLPGLLPGFRRYAEHLAAGVLGKLPVVRPGMADTVIFWLGVVVMVAAVIWMVALMWKGFSVCFKARGTRAVVAFIFAIIVAEALSKIAIGAMTGWQLPRANFSASVESSLKMERK